MAKLPLNTARDSSILRRKPPPSWPGDVEDSSRKEVFVSRELSVVIFFLVSIYNFDSRDCF